MAFRTRTSEPTPHEVVRDSQEPFDQRKPAAEVFPGIWAVEFQVDGLRIFGGREPIGEQGGVGAHTRRESVQLAREVDVKDRPGYRARRT